MSRIGSADKPYNALVGHIHRRGRLCIGGSHRAKFAFSSMKEGKGHGLPCTLADCGFASD